MAVARGLLVALAVYAIITGLWLGLTMAPVASGAHLIGAPLLILVGGAVLAQMARVAR